MKKQLAVVQGGKVDISETSVNYENSFSVIVKISNTCRKSDFNASAKYFLGIKEKASDWAMLTNSSCKNCMACL